MDVSKSKISMDLRFPKAYNSPVDGLACQSKEVMENMASHTVRGTLHNEHGTWIVRARVFDPCTGEIRQRSKSTGLKVKDKTKRKAEQAMREIVELWEQEANRDPAEKQRKEVPLFSEYIKGWLSNKDLAVRPNTAKTYWGYAKTPILPALGNYPVNAVTWRVLQDFCDRMLADHAKSSVKKYFIVIRGALDDAVRDEAIPANPEHLVKWPKAERTQTGRALTDEQASKLLEAAEQAGEPIRAAITLALYYGLRRSEVCGLRWIDIDFGEGIMHIRHTVTQNGSLILDDDHTKTKGSNRVITLIGDTIPYLKKLRSEQLKQGLLVDKVVAWPDGRPVRPDGIKSMYRTLLKKAGIEKARFHDLRHTAATMLSRAGVPPKQLQAFLGHSDIEMTLGVYVHATDIDTAETSKKMGEIIRSIYPCKSCSDFCSESGPRTAAVK